MRKTIDTLRSLRTRLSAPMVAIALFAPVVVAGMTTVSSPADAQAPKCAPRDALIDSLSRKYDETPVSMGVTSSGSLIEVLASPGGSWTILVTVPGGPTCLVSSGDGWRDSPLQVAQDPAV